jgi:hypothetical protein
VRGYRARVRFFFAFFPLFFLRGKVSFADRIVPLHSGEPQRQAYSFTSAFVVLGVRS